MRKHKRYALDLPVAVLEQTGQGGGRLFLLRTADVSASGAMFHTQRELPAGANVRLIFFLHVDPRRAAVDRRYSFYGTVVRSEPGRFAVAFGREMRVTEPGAPEASRGVTPRPDGERG
jgi:hypothetical protein